MGQLLVQAWRGCSARSSTEPPGTLISP